MRHAGRVVKYGVVERWSWFDLGGAELVRSSKALPTDQDDQVLRCLNVER